MAKKKYYKKKAVLKAISKYMRTKLNYITDIHYNVEGNLYIDGEQTNSFIIGQALLGNQNEFQHLGKQYAFVKLRGVLIEVNPGGINGGYDYAICLGNANDVIAFGNLKTQPNILLIDTHQKSRMYIKVSSEFTSTNSIELFNNIALLPMRQGNGDARLSVKLTLYLTFKTNV